MKVVLFCGGQGLRLRDYSETIPKPMVPIGQRPMLWNVMKYYASFGHRDFILCLGWQAQVIKNYFLDYDECVSNDFQLSDGGRKISLLNTDIDDWKITFVDTGVNSNIGERLAAIRPHLAGERTFLANYSDGLSDFPLPLAIERHHQTGAVATFLSVRPTQSFHAVEFSEEGGVCALTPIRESDLWMNAGFFVLDSSIFDVLGPGEELVAEPFERLIQRGRLQSVKYEGFFGCVDTYKERQMLEDMYVRGDRPWEIWRSEAPVAKGATIGKPSSIESTSIPLPRKAR